MPSRPSMSSPIGADKTTAAATFSAAAAPKATCLMLFIVAVAAPFAVCMMTSRSWSASSAARSAAARSTDTTDAPVLITKRPSTPFDAHRCDADALRHDWDRLSAASVPVAAFAVPRMLFNGVFAATKQRADLRSGVVGLPPNCVYPKIPSHAAAITAHQTGAAVILVSDMVASPPARPAAGMQPLRDARDHAPECKGYALVPPIEFDSGIP